MEIVSSGSMDVIVGATRADFPRFLKLFLGPIGADNQDALEMFSSKSFLMEMALTFIA